ncbi:MAG: sensor histidine kinase [Acidimicrobiales bacterium]
MSLRLLDRAERWSDVAHRSLVGPHTVVVASSVLAVFALVEAVAVAAGEGAHQAPYVLASGVLALCATLPPAFLGRLPAAIATTAADLLSLATVGHLTVGASIVELIVLYRVTRADSSPRGTEVLATVLGGTFLLAALAGGRLVASETGVLTLLLAVLGPSLAWVGIARRASDEAVLQRAARRDIAGTLLEHTARGERARIARELHDVVAHHISMVAVQAETARLTTPGMPPAGAERLRAIGDTARTALTEMRRLLGVLREERTGEVPARRPQPGLAELNELLDEARAASATSVRMILSGTSLPLDPVVQLAVYRIVQEALTNTRRHAPGAAVDVELQYQSDRLELRIRDNGPGPTSPPWPPRSTDVATGEQGHGLAGMAERAAAVGGELHTGAAPGGGFLVGARLPAKIVEQS